MGFAKNIAKLWGSSSKQNLKSSATAPLLVQFDAGQAKFTPRRYDALAEEGFKKNVIVYRCVKLIAQNAASVPFAVYKGRKGNKIRLFEHPLLSLLTRPNPMQSGAELFEALFGFYLIAGNSYLEAVGKEGEEPAELWALRPDRMQVIAGKTGVPASYRYRVNGKYIDFKIDRITGKAKILHIKSFNPLDDWYGMSPLEAAAFSIDQHNEAAKWNTALLQNNARPSGALVYNPPYTDASNVLSDEQREKLKNELEEYYTGAKNTGRPLVLEGGLDWREMGLSPKDMDWITGKDIAAREIALAFNIPPQLVGVEGSLTYANFEQARLALYDDAVIPLLEHVKNELNNWLSPNFGDDITIEFDIDAIEALAPRREKIWSRLTNANFMTINEKRAAVGLKPIENGDKI